MQATSIIDNILDYEIPTINGYYESDYSVANKMIDSLFYRFSLNMGPTSLPHWIDKFSSQQQANRMILKLVRDGVISTSIVHNYAQISISKLFLLKRFNQSELDELILTSKLSKHYPLEPDSVFNKLNPVADDVKLTSGICKSGLVRFGFAKAGTHQFQYDTVMMSKYHDEIVRYSVKAMRKMEEKLDRSLRLSEGYDYESLIEKIIGMIVENKSEHYILGSLVLCSRGRAIYACLKTIFNPLSNKMARALIVSPAEKATDESKKNCYLFISEIVNGFDGNIARKSFKGLMAYNNRKFHDLDLSTEDGIDELFENIWLERLYNELDMIKANPKHLITTPLEVDFGASNMTIIGLLLNHQDYVDHTNYMWKIDGLSKLHVKSAQTPYVFGSSASPQSLWKKNKLEYTDEQVKIILREQTTGKFAFANRLKDIIIGECNPTPIMNLVVGHERCIVECNKTKNVGETKKQYVVLDSTTEKFKIIHHTNTHKTPDLVQFKRYFMTGLIHQIDPQILDNICLNMDWILPIHDAGIVTWSGASTMRKLAKREMEDIRANGDSIVFNYLKSINLSAKGWKQYAKLKADIKLANINNGEFRISEYLLK